MSPRKIETRLRALERLAEGGEGILLILDRADVGAPPEPRDGFAVALAEPGESTDAVVARVVGDRVPAYVIRRRIVHPNRDTLPDDLDDLP